MADIELDDLRQRRDGLRGHVVEAMAGMDFEAEPRAACVAPARMRRELAAAAVRLRPRRRRRTRRRYGVR